MVIPRSIRYIHDTPAGIMEVLSLPSVGDSPRAIERFACHLDTCRCLGDEAGLRQCHRQLPKTFETCGARLLCPSYPTSLVVLTVFGLFRLDLA